MDVFEKWYNRTIRYLSFRPRSEKEIKDFLKRKNVDEKITQRILQKLKEETFLDDREFTRWWIEQRTEFRKMGIRLIKLELRQKGIEDDLIDEVIHSSTVTIQTDEERAKELIERQARKHTKLSRQELFRKLGQYLSRLGFDYETIKHAIDEVLKEPV